MASRKVRIANKRSNVRNVVVHDDERGESRIVGTETIVNDCPDCTRGLTSIAGVLVCPIAYETPELRAVVVRLLPSAKHGDVIACGTTPQ